MKTSNFRYYTGDNGVAICIYPPIDWCGLQFPALAPTREIFFAKKQGKINEEEYEKRYREEVLSKLDPQKIYDIFKDNVLLCWENPGKFCHRRIVAQWLHETIGVIVDEWNAQDDKLEKLKNDKKIKPLF